ncbi:hypothetical protein JKP88DRAFT_264457 [Tribonema minus]|uniref:DUF155 domain-containing protein n=1 Tax=Tribonema minus TaxID=303371 RepID=A0A835YQ30_9STRA|nr:hypothetical protein JKP88DRAFT_264457 [Tribonema minus]
MMRRCSLDCMRSAQRVLSRRNSGSALLNGAGLTGAGHAPPSSAPAGRRTVLELPPAGSLPWGDDAVRKSSANLNRFSETMPQARPAAAAAADAAAPARSRNGRGGDDGEPERTPREVLDGLPKLACTSHYIARGVDMHKVYNKFYRMHSSRAFNNYMIVMGPFANFKGDDAPAAAAQAAMPPAPGTEAASRAVIYGHAALARPTSQPKHGDRCTSIVAPEGTMSPPPPPSAAAAAAAAAAQRELNVDGNLFLASTAAGAPSSFIVLFKYGSVVFFNMSLEEQECHLAQIRQVCDPTPLPAKEARSEDLTLKVYEHLEDASRMCEDYTVVRALDLKNVMVISSVMAQTVALDHYASVVDKRYGAVVALDHYAADVDVDKRYGAVVALDHYTADVDVDKMVMTFTELNAGLETQGVFNKAGKHRLFKVSSVFDEAGKHRLFKLVGQQNTVFMDLVSRLALLEKSDVAWKHAEYYKVWEGLRNEYELKDRFSHLEWKLNLIQRNTKFFLEILHNQKSDNLEWTIIILIAFEIIVSLADMADANPGSPQATEAPHGSAPQQHASAATRGGGGSSGGGGSGGGSSSGGGGGSGVTQLMEGCCCCGGSAPQGSALRQRRAQRRARIGVVKRVLSAVTFAAALSTLGTVAERGTPAGGLVTGSCNYDFDTRACDSSVFRPALLLLVLQNAWLHLLREPKL